MHRNTLVVKTEISTSELKEYQRQLLLTAMRVPSPEKDAVKNRDQVKTADDVITTFRKLCPPDRFIKNDAHYDHNMEYIQEIKEYETTMQALEKHPSHLAKIVRLLQSTDVKFVQDLQRISKAIYVDDCVKQLPVELNNPLTRYALSDWAYYDKPNVAFDLLVKHVKEIEHKNIFPFLYCLSFLARLPEPLVKNEYINPIKSNIRFFERFFREISRMGSEVVEAITDYNYKALLPYLCRGNVAYIIHCLNLICIEETNDNLIFYKPIVPVSAKLLKTIINAERTPFAQAISELLQCMREKRFEDACTTEHLTILCSRGELAAFMIDELKQRPAIGSGELNHIIRALDKKPVLSRSEFQQLVQEQIDLYNSKKVFLMGIYSKANSDNLLHRFFGKTDDKPNHPYGDINVIKDIFRFLG